MSPTVVFPLFFGFGLSKMSPTVVFPLFLRFGLLKMSLTVVFPLFLRFGLLKMMPKAVFPLFLRFGLLKWAQKWFSPISEVWPIQNDAKLGLFGGFSIELTCVSWGLGLQNGVPKGGFWPVFQLS